MRDIGYYMTEEDWYLDRMWNAGLDSHGVPIDGGRGMGEEAGADDGDSGMGQCEDAEADEAVSWGGCFEDDEEDGENCADFSSSYGDEDEEGWGGW